MVSKRPIKKKKKKREVNVTVEMHARAKVDLSVPSNNFLLHQNRWVDIFPAVPTAGEVGTNLGSRLPCHSASDPVLRHGVLARKRQKMFPQVALPLYGNL